MLTEKINYKPHKIELASLIKKTDFEIKYLKIYLSSSTESLKIRESILKKEMQKDIDKKVDDESFIQDLYEKEVGKISSYFYHSSIVLIYTFLENSLYKICSEIQIETNSPLSYKDLSGNNIIKKSKYYLQITSGIEFTEANKLWDRITQFQKLRNDIVHQNSTISGSDEAVREKNEKNLKNMFPEIKIEESDFVLKDCSLPIEFIDLISDFLKFIYEKIESIPFLVKNNEEKPQDFDDSMPF